MIKSAGRYEIIAELGRGGFGQVYKALDPTVNRMVAVKVLAADGDPDTLARFRAEAASSGRLHHPNIVTIYDFGEQDKVPYIVMELLEGQDLQRAIAERKPVALWEKVQIMSQVAAGLGHAHSHGIVHRDVKPANVMLLPNGDVKIMDFGIALVSQATHTRLTPRGAMIGTFRYMAPEQFRGLSQDARSDIFAYGLMYYELLTGVHPFYSIEPAAMMYNVLNLEPVPVGELCPECPAELQAIIARLLQKDPDFRYQTLEDVLFDTAPMLLVLRRQRAQELLGQAHTARQQGLLDNAQVLIRQVLEMDPACEGAREFREQLQTELRRNAIRPRVETLIRKGRDEMAAGSPKEAVATFESAMRLDPTDTHAQSLLEQARLALEQSRKIAQLVVDASRALDARDFVGAKHIAHQVLELAPSDPRARQIFETAQATLAEQERNARLAEELPRARRLIDIHSWDQAAELLEPLQQQFPEVAEVHTLFELLRTGRLNEQRQNLLASGLAAARHEIQAGDLGAARDRLQTMQTEFADSADVDRLLQFVKTEIETRQRRDTVDRSLEGARGLAAQNRFTEAWQVLEAALSIYPADPPLQREFLALSSAQRRFRIEEALAAARSLQSQGRLDEAASALEVFTGGPEPSIDELRESIARERETQRRAAELREIVRRANDLLAENQIEEATRLLQAPPADLRNHPEIVKLLTIAEKQRLRATALEEALSGASSLESVGRFDEALELLQAVVSRYGVDPRVDKARNAILDAREAHRQDAELRGVVLHAKELLAQGNALEATLLFKGYGEGVRDNSEATEIWKMAEAEVGRQVERQSALRQTISSATPLRNEERFDEALSILETFQNRFGIDPEAQALQLAVKRDRDAAILREQEVRDALARAEALLSQQNPEGALEFLRQAPETVQHHTDAQKFAQRAEAAVTAKSRKTAIDKFVSEAVSLFLQGKLEEALVVLDRGLQQFPGEPALAGLHAEILEARETDRRAATSRLAAAEVRNLLTAKRYEEATRTITKALAGDAGNSELQQLRDEVNSLYNRSKTELAEQEAHQQLLQAHSLLSQDPAEAVALLSRLLQKYPGLPEIAETLAKAREAALRQELFNEVERLCQHEEFAAALSKLNDAAPDSVGQLDKLRERVTSLQRKAQLRVANEAVQASERIRREDPKRALAALEKLEQSVRDRPEVREAIEKCQSAIALANRQAAVAEVEAFCSRGKFAKARAGYENLVARFGSDPALHELWARIEAGAPRKSASAEVSTTAGSFNKLPVRIAAILGVTTLLATGVWMLTRGKPVPPVALIPVEIRTDPPGASIRLGDRSCQTPNCNLELPAGTYSLQAQLNGYEPSQQTLAVQAAKSPRLVDITLKPIVVPPAPGPAAGTLVVQAGLPDALVFIDNLPRGRTDASGNFTALLEAKAYRVRVEKLGYEMPRDRKVTILDKGSQKETFILSPQNAKLEIRGAPEGVELRAGTSILGLTKGSAVFSALVQPGDQILRITEGTSTRQFQQRFEPGQTVTIDWASVAPAIASVPPPPPKAAPPPPPPKPADPSEQEWEQVRSTSDPSRLQAYLDKYSNGSHTPEAQNLMESIIWTRTNRDDSASLRAYLNHYPRGLHTADASSRLAELIWNAVDKRDEQALRTYIGQNPDSPYRPESQRLLDLLRADAERKKKDDPEKGGPAAERQKIAQALAQYKQAYEARNIEMLRSVYPSLSGNSLKAIRDAFGRADSIQLDLKPLKEPEISGDSATVRVERSFRQREGRKELPPVQGTFTIRLHKIGQAWVIDSIM